ncbi:unnamed protein product [Miscanthus lutarioriparius]|uniref:HMA domain-containing protein n=1 Tax=Miscanthus lutarioriparius TaxID=422564 RepID=A0A811QS17_9POAL|nr:unnamed protein product [Miscanthus lutarioriparius]
MKQKMVIKVSMPCERSRSKALSLAAQADGVISVEITGDDKDKLEVVGDAVDTVCLASCLRRKLGHADILQVEEVKDPPPQPEPVQPQPEGYTCECPFYHHHPPPPMVICECEGPSNCAIM